MIWLACILFALVTVVLSIRQNNDPLAFLNTQNAAGEKEQHAEAFIIHNLTEQSLLTRIKININNLKNAIGEKLAVKLTIFTLSCVAVTLGLHSYLSELPAALLFLTIFLSASAIAAVLLKSRQRKSFENSFPDALNLLSGAISTGESLMHAIIFVGDSLDGPVGQEFKKMGQRLSLGQSADEVLMKSCQCFPYPLFIFFAITLRANINRGGQLKDIISRMNEVLFASQTLQKKKNAMTSEARMSAKIVGTIPLAFLMFMKFVSPENFDFVMHNPDGRIIFYYVLGSECLGFFIIWQLMRRVQG